MSGGFLAALQRSRDDIGEMPSPTPTRQMRPPSIAASWSGKKRKARADAVEALHDAERAHLEAVQNETKEAQAHIEAVQDETADAARQRAEMVAAQEIF